MDDLAFAQPPSCTDKHVPLGPAMVTKRGEDGIEGRIGLAVATAADPMPNSTDQQPRSQAACSSDWRGRRERYLSAWGASPTATSDGGSSRRHRELTADGLLPDMVVDVGGNRPFLPSGKGRCWQAGENFIEDENPHLRLGLFFLPEPVELGRVAP